MSVTENAIAIIGLGCRFPGANNSTEYWDLLRSGKNTITHFSKDELLCAGVNPAILDDSNYIRARGIVDSLEVLDEKKLTFSKTEIGHLNTQSRIFLHLVWQALEDAGINPTRCPKETAVFTGVNDSEFLEVLVNGYSKKHTTQDMSEYFYTKALSSLVAYQFNLQGKSFNVHTGCSTSLVAIMQACDELLLQKADLAIAGGTSIICPQQLGYFYEEEGVFSPDGVCRPFDAKANGTVMSNGAGVVILKRLEDAIEAGDKVYSIIAGKAMNNDGRMKLGFLAPSIQRQHACIQQAWDDANIGLEQIDYIEAHASATVVGDPIEIFALKKIMNGKKYHKKWCGIGSVKSNIGHTTVASGMAAIIKASLMTHHKAIVPTINFNSLNNNIDLEKTPFYIASDYQELPKNKESFYVGVSNFGLGGTNAHIVLRDAKITN